MQAKVHGKLRNRLMAEQSVQHIETYYWISNSTRIDNQMSSQPWNENPYLFQTSTVSRWEFGKVILYHILYEYYYLSMPGKIFNRVRKEVLG